MHVYYSMLVLIMTLHGSETKAYDPVYIIYSHAGFCLNFIEQKGIALIGSHVASYNPINVHVYTVKNDVFWNTLLGCWDNTLNLTPLKVFRNT